MPRFLLWVILPVVTDESRIAAYLELFDLPDAFTEAQLKQAYHDLVQVWHPDKHSHNERLRHKADEKMKEINQAYQVLQAGLRNGTFRFYRSATRPASPSPHTAPASAHPRPQDPQSKPSESAPQAAPEAAGGSLPKWLTGNAFWILLIGLMLLVLIVAPRGRKVAAPDIPQAASPPGDAEPPLLFSIEGPPFGTNPAGVPLSPALDSKNGFKELKFGMSVDEARRRLRPDRVTTNQYNQLMTFWYGPSANNKLGDFPLDSINVSFFRGRLFKIEVAFSSNQAQILEALRGSFGASSPNDSLTRDSEPLRAECWFGQKTFCAVVAPRNSDRQSGWDAMVMYDQGLNREAQSYAAEEPLRAAQALSEDGFGEFKFGMTLKEFTGKLRHPSAISEAGVGQKEMVISGSDQCRIGRYPLSSLRALFFQERLCRIDLDFTLHQKEIYQGFTNRFPAAADTDAWSRSEESLRARQYTGQRSVAAVLAPHSPSLPWESIVLYDRQMDERRRQFEREAPNRAAKDL